MLQSQSFVERWGEVEKGDTRGVWGFVSEKEKERVIVVVVMVMLTRR